jgi:hypothetical protein
MRFLRHHGIYQSDAGSYSNPSPSWSRRLPPTTPDSGPRTCREEHALLIVPMSSGRLFLDRVGRHQSPSLLHRRDQINTHFSDSQAKGDISTLPGWGHFYFALTHIVIGLTRSHARYILCTSAGIIALFQSKGRKFRWLLHRVIADRLS